MDRDLAAEQHDREDEIDRIEADAETAERARRDAIAERTARALVAHDLTPAATIILAVALDECAAPIEAQLGDATDMLHELCMLVGGVATGDQAGPSLYERVEQIVAECDEARAGWNEHYAAANAARADAGALAGALRELRRCAMATHGIDPCNADYEAFYAASSAARDLLAAREEEAT